MPSTIVLITGANSGVGYATTKVIACKSSDFHVIMASRSIEKLEAAKKEIEDSGIKGTLSILQLEITDEESVMKAAQAVESQYGRLDVLINNAGVAPLGDNAKKQFQETMDVNVVGPAVVSSYFRPLLLKSANARSIFVSSRGGSFGTNQGLSNFDRFGMHAYPVSKAALNMMAFMESKLFGPQGIKVWAVCPGFVRSHLRGTSEEQIDGWGINGGAGDPLVSGQIILGIIEGARDADVGSLVSKDGVYPW